VSENLTLCIDAVIHAPVPISRIPKKNTHTDTLIKKGMNIAIIFMGKSSEKELTILITDRRALT